MTVRAETAQVVTRFAPSPTGRLHLGHAWSALQAHDLARRAGGQFRLRIEDIDGARSRTEYVAAILEDLRWLGLRWDGDAVFQSERLPIYNAALEKLKDQGLAYPCFCTRAGIAAEIAASLSAPHGSGGPLYPGTCRKLDGAERSVRLAWEPHGWRSEEHTSELQSLMRISYPVFCLKNKTPTNRPEPLTAHSPAPDRSRYL